MPTEAESFFEKAEQLAVEALSADRLDFDTFDRQVGLLADDLAGIAGGPQLVLDSAADTILSGDGSARWQLPIGSARRLGLAFQDVLGRRLGALYQPLVLWWTEGSSIVEPSCLIDHHLPHPDSFVALLDGAWADRDWRTVPVQVDVAPGAEVLIDEATPPRFRSAAASHAGRVRELNQDAFIERPEIGIWAVADGVGGHSHGEVASRMVCDAIADLVPSASFADVIQSVRQGMDRVNDYLVRAAANDETRRSGSTVVVVLVRGSRCAVLWAGDSRVYRWRGGRLVQVTRDHAVSEAGASGGEDESHAITRAVGGDATLELDEIQDRVHVGDRFLLCTDGLTREVPEARIQSWMEHADIRKAVDGLVGSALEAGAKDNVTALIVEAGA